MLDERLGFPIIANAAGKAEVGPPPIFDVETQALFLVCRLVLVPFGEITEDILEEAPEVFGLADTLLNLVLEYSCQSLLSAGPLASPEKPPRSRVFWPLLRLLITISARSRFSPNPNGPSNKRMVSGGLAFPRTGMALCGNVLGLLNGDKC